MKIHMILVIVGLIGLLHKDVTTSLPVVIPKFKAFSYNKDYQNSRIVPDYVEENNAKAIWGYWIFKPALPDRVYLEITDFEVSRDSIIIYFWMMQ